MTLCISWKSADGRIHLAADSRVSFGSGQPADVAVKVAKLPYHITEVTHANDPRQVELLGEIGITFCGSTVSMFAIKESIAEVLLHMQAMEIRSVSLHGICEIIFATYQRILPQVVTAMLSNQAVANLIVTGFCPANQAEEAYLIETNASNISNLRRILDRADQQHEVLGSGAKAAIALLESMPSPKTEDFLSILQSVIDDPNVPSVGGKLVYGHTEAKKFLTFGLCVVDSDGVGYWRAGLNYNSPVFQLSNQSGLHIHYPMIDGLTKMG